MISGMSGRSVSHYAYVHARIRGRIAAMPGKNGWQQILNASDLETAIETMSAAGLQYWVADFPRRPAPAEIERRCLISLLGIALFVTRYLPRHWENTAQWLLDLPHLLQLRTVLSANADKGLLLPGSPFHDIILQPRPQRRKLLADSRYGSYLDDTHPPESCWAQRFASTLPVVQGQEAQVIKHLVQVLSEHFRGIKPGMSAEQVWVQRRVLAARLRLLLAGDPFHGGILLIYALLECIQFERIRAILLLRAYQWPQKMLGGLL